MHFLLGQVLLCFAQLFAHPFFFLFLKAIACLNGSKKIVDVNSDSCAGENVGWPWLQGLLRPLMAATMVRENALLYLFAFYPQAFIQAVIVFIHVVSLI